MLKSIFLASAFVIGLAGPASASSICGEDPNASNAHVKNWCDSKSENNNTSDQNGGQNND
jgi:hypothetical protein